MDPQVLRRRNVAEKDKVEEKGEDDPVDTKPEVSNDHADHQANGRNVDAESEFTSEHHRSEIARLWQQSRYMDDEELKGGDARSSSERSPRPKGVDRPVTRANIVIAFKLFRLTLPRLIDIIWVDDGFTLAGWVGGNLLRSVIPACNIWASSKMLNLVQQSFIKGPVDPKEVYRAAFIALLLSSFNTIYHFFTRRQARRITMLVNARIQGDYMAAKLSLSIPSMSHPYLSALLFEAGIFAGIEHKPADGTRYGGTIDPFTEVSSIVEVFSLTIAMWSQLYLVTGTILSGGDSIYKPSTIILLTLALGPSLLDACRGWSLRRKRSIFGYGGEWKRRRSLEARSRQLRVMATHDSHKQEIVLFGLKDWVMTRWKEIKQMQVEEGEEKREMREFWDIGTSILRFGLGDLFNILLALQTLPTTLSLGSIELYQRSSTALLGTIQMINSKLSSVFQIIFLFAAFCEATSSPEDVERRILRQDVPFDQPLLDYETVRNDQGMTIEACNLGFAYPDSKKQVLRDINLTVAAGQSLAIVGFNGGGKTTLVKVLMGLFNHTGTLLINGHPIEDYDPTTLHSRTSCLFQDFSKYSLSLRENVGLGSVHQMNNSEEISSALTLGGAGELRDKIGLDRQLRLGLVAREDDEVDEPMTTTTMTNGGSTTKGALDNGASVTSLKAAIGLAIKTVRTAKDVIVGTPQPKAKSENKETSKALSGGQWQRIALGRAFLRSDEADLVVFDEPSASLDPLAEAQLFQRIHSLSTRSDGRKITTIYVSHRFSTVRKADKIAVVEDGTIIEHGSHDELMKLNGRYHELFTLSKEGFEDPHPNSSVVASDGESGMNGSAIRQAEQQTPLTPVSPILSTS